MGIALTKNFYADSSSYSNRLKSVAYSKMVRGGLTVPFILKLIDTGYVGAMYRPISNDSFNRLKNRLNIIKTIFDKHFEDNWDFIFDLVEPGILYLNIIVRFPDITIRNSEGREHNIKDLLVKLSLSSNHNGKVYFERITGQRATLSFKEWSSLYLHSHLHSKDINHRDKVFDFTAFCLGTGEIGDLKAEIQGYNEEDYVEGEDMATFEELIEIFVLTLGNYVRWESLEGGPYIRMERITMKSNTSGYYPDFTERNDYRSISENSSDFFTTLFDATWGYVNGELSWLKTRELEVQIIGYLFRCYKDMVPYFAYYKDEYGNTFSYCPSNRATVETLRRTDFRVDISQSKKYKEYLPSKFIPIKGKKIFFKVEEPTEDDLKDTSLSPNQFFLNEKFYDFLCKQSADYFKTIYIRNRNFRQAVGNNCISNLLEESSISVSENT